MRIRAVWPWRTGGRNSRWSVRPIPAATRLLTPRRTRRCGPGKPARWSCRATASARDRGHRFRPGEPLQRDIAGDGAQLPGGLEGDDTGERDIKSEFERPLRQQTAGGEAMDDAGRRLFLGQDGNRLGVGVAAVDDERQSGADRRARMNAKRGFLVGARAVVVVEVEPGFADADHLGMAGEARYPFRPLPFLRRGFMGMGSDRTPDVGIGFGYGAHQRKLGELGADRDQGRDAGAVRADDDSARPLPERNRDGNGESTRYNSSVRCDGLTAGRSPVMPGGNAASRGSSRGSRRRQVRRRRPR